VAIRLYSQPQIGQAWVDRFQGRQPQFACILGFTETGLLPGISAAGATPRDRQFTALADAEFLYSGVQPQPRYPLPPLTAGGTQMLAVYALLRAIAQAGRLNWQPEQVVVGTTRWVAEDATGDTVGLAKLLNAPLMATQLCFANSRFAQLRAYEQGYVKEGVGAGGLAIAAHLYRGWHQRELLAAIEALAAEYAAIGTIEARPS